MELWAAFPARPITSDEELDAVEKVIDSLRNKLGDCDLTQDEKDYIHILELLIEDYEDQDENKYLIPDIYGSDLLKELIKEYGLLQKDLLPIFSKESIISEVLSKKRQLTEKHIDGLAKYFNIPHSAFFPR